MYELDSLVFYYLFKGDSYFMGIIDWHMELADGTGTKDIVQISVLN